MPTRLDDDILQRRARLTSAALRAAYAWSARSQHPKAFEELSRMTGVVMLELGPGHRPATPVDLVAHLQQPLGRLLPQLPDVDDQRYGSGIDEVVLLDGVGVLTDAAYEIGSDYVRDVIAAADPGRAWLPAWSWMRANDVETELFGKLKAAGDDAAYTAARQFLVEYPAGDAYALAEACNEKRVARVARYVPIPEGQSYRIGAGRWWWPCRVCGWAMDVRGAVVRCRYRYHHATYQVAEKGLRGPVLLAVDQRLPSGVPRGLPVRQDAANAEQVDEPVWRFVVVPGATEVRLWRLLQETGARTASLYPGGDRYDLEVIVGDQVWDVDVKEHATVEGLLRRVSEKPPTARYIVLPETHRGQVHALVDALPGYRVLTESELIRQVKAALRRTKAATA